jgi:Flp pilus assembly protein TadD
LVCALLAVAVLGVYGQVVDHGFLGLDDQDYIVGNPTVRAGLSWNGLRWAAVTFHGANWHPLTWLSHMLDCELFGLRAGGHHLGSVGFHIVTAILLLLVLRMMTRSLWPSAMVAALFALHPLRVESVAWAAERKDLLAGLFWMLTFFAYVWYARKPGIRRYLLVALSFALGLMAKPMLVTLPLVLLLVDVWPLARWRPGPLGMLGGKAAPGAVPTGRLVWEKVPLLTLSAASAAMTLLAQQSSGAVKSIQSVPMGARFANALTAGVGYLGKTIWPVNLAVPYPHPAYLDGDSLGAGLTAMAAAFLLFVITLLVVRQVAKRPFLAVGWFWYLVTLLPVIGLVQVGVQSMADRYTYLPLVGPIIAVVWLLRGLAVGPRGRMLLRVLALTALAACSALSWRQVGYWRDDVTLYTHALRVTERNYLAHNSLGKALLAGGDLDGAQAHFEQARRIQPEFADVHNSFGVLAIQKGRLEEAVDHFARAIELSPDFARFESNLGGVLARLGRLDRAEHHLERAVRLAPDLVDAHANLGMLLGERGRLARSVEHLRRAVQLDPESPRTRYPLGLALARHGQADEAEEQLLRALELAVSAGQTDLAKSIEASLRSHRAGQPRRER